MSRTPLPAIALGLLVLSAALAPASPARAFPGRFDGVPNGAVLRAQWMASPGNQCTLCHTMASPSDCAADMTNPCLNAAFGMPFSVNGWTEALATADLDGDGFTNGQELQEPAGTWMAGATAPGIAAYVTAPYDAADHPGLHDEDMDHVCWFGRDGDGDFQCTGATEKAVADRDCDDDNASRHTGAAELCDAADQDCDGAIDEGLTDCDPGVGSCGAGQGQNQAGDCHPRELIDGDRDRFCHSGEDLSEPADWDCVDAGEQTGRNDCDDFDAMIAPSVAEDCLDGEDNDCDALVDGDDPDCADYADGDGDGFCPMGEDLDDDGQCDSEEEAESERRDCDDAVAAINPTADELCTTGVDEDCDGLMDGRDDACADYRDADGDGFCAAGRDGNGDFLCDGSGEQGTAVDCDDARPDVYAGAPENCIDERDNDCDGDVDEAESCVSDVDADEDGYCPLGRDLSEPPDGDCTDPGEDQPVSDCNDGNDAIHPGRTEQCADRTDNDCDGDVDLADEDCERLLDGDGDAYCPEGYDSNGDGDCLDFDEARPVRDCDDRNPERRPRAGERCDDGVDNDCDGEIDGFDESCTCDDDDDCPVSEPCMVGRCVAGDGCRMVRDPLCDDDDGGVDERGEPGAAGSSARDGGRREEGDDAPAELEDVGCGCRLAGARAGTRVAPWLAFVLVLGLRLRSRSRRRR